MFIEFYIQTHDLLELIKFKMKKCILEYAVVNHNLLKIKTKIHDCLKIKP